MQHSGTSRARAIDQIATDAIARRVFPGAVVAVARGDRLLHCAAYGTLTYDTAAPVACDTIYDIASLTKMFTATAVLQLLDQGSVALETPVHTLLPRFTAPAVTIFHLLTHTSGLDIRLSAMRALGADGLRDAVYATQPQQPPGTSVAYTNVNSLLLGDIVVALTGRPLDTVLNERIMRPLGMRDTWFCPPVQLHARIAPTEIDSDWRARLVHGSVHDESAHALGGVAGHAGLFATADDLLAFCQMWRHALAQPTLLSTPTARQATQNQTATLNTACGLGWMLDRPTFMGGAPTGSFGHTGFTGPAMLCIPRHDLIVVVLSNRVYPRRGPATHHAVTAAIVDAVLAL